MLEIDLSPSFWGAQQKFIITRIASYLLLATICFIANPSCQQQQIDSIPLKKDLIEIDLYHKFNSNQQFKQRGSILVHPKTEYRVAKASIFQHKLDDSDLKILKESSEQGDSYYLKASLRQKGSSDKLKQPLKSTQTLVRACSLYLGNLDDFITVNLSPSNEFINVNLFTTDPECKGQRLEYRSGELNTTILVESGAVGPTPDTATYIKRLEEERRSKLKEGKESNQSFFAKYWIYIVPAVIILMIFSGPADQGAR